jgi:mannose-6-phosphate isomerase-like protein (cupin superfamily)
MLPFRFPVTDALAAVPTPEGRFYAEIFTRGSLKLEVYAPKGTDPQRPHGQDELYVVIKGEGEFILEDRRVKFSAGDALFAPAGAVHRFENFSDDFAVWVMFYGPEGGEKV